MGVLGRPAKVGNPAPILTCRAVAYGQHAQCVESSNGSMVWGCVGWGCGVVRGHVGVQQQPQQEVEGGEEQLQHQHQMTRTCSSRAVVYSSNSE